MEIKIDEANEAERVLVHTCGRWGEFTIDPPASGRIVRKLMRSSGFWVALDTRQRAEIHPFPADDPHGRGTHVLCEGGDDDVTALASSRQVRSDGP